MSNPPVEGFVRPSLGIRCSVSSLHTDITYPYFDNLKFDIFDVGGPQCHLSRLYCVLGDFHMFTITDTLEKFLVF